MQDEDDEWRRNNDDDKVFILVKVFYWVTDIFLNLHMYDWDLYETTTKAFLDWIPYAVISGILIVLMIIFEINRVLEKRKEKEYRYVNMGQQILESVGTIMLPLFFLPWGTIVLWIGSIFK